MIPLETGAILITRRKPQMAKILIVDDEPRIRELIREHLQYAGYVCEEAGDGSAALSLLSGGGFDLVILDLMLPGVDGFEICRKVRAEKNTPIIMVSAKKDDIDKIRGLGLGADDYMTKPFSPSELVARVKAHLARYERLIGSSVETRNIIEIRGIKIDKDARRVWVNEEEKAFTSKEFDLLCFLAENPNRVYTKEELFKEIWDMVGEYMEFTQKNGYFNYKRNEQAKYWMYESINDTLRETFYHNPAVEKMLNFTEQQVLNNEISSFVAAKRMMDLFLENLSAKK